MTHIANLVIRSLIWIGEGFIGAAIILIGCSLAVLIGGLAAYIVAEAVEGIVR